MNPRTLLFSLAVLAMPSVANAALTASWAAPANGTVQGVSVGDLDGDGVLEVASLVRGTSSQRIVVHDAAGTLRWSVASTTPIAGFPTFADFDGDGADEIGYCELSTTGRCLVLDGDGKYLWASGPYYYPGMSLGGPAAASINANVGVDMVVMSWGGYVALLDGATGTQDWYYDAWTAHEELFHGHAAIGDLDNNGTLEIVVGGAYHGTVIAIDAATGAEVWFNTDLAEISGYFKGSGVALADLDGIQGTLEVVFAVEALVPRLMALTSTGLVRWVTNVDEVLTWSTPVVANLDADGLPEVILQSGDGTVRLYSNEGIARSIAELGDATWMSGVALADVNGDYQPEIIATTRNKVFVLGSDLSEISQLAIANSGLNASACVADLNGDAVGEIIVGGYTSKAIHALSLGTAINYEWTTLAGSSRHTAFLTTQDPPEQPVAAGGDETTSAGTSVEQGGMVLAD